MLWANIFLPFRAITLTESLVSFVTSNLHFKCLKCGEHHDRSYPPALIRMMATPEKAMPYFPSCFSGRFYPTSFLSNGNGVYGEHGTRKERETLFQFFFYPLSLPTNSCPTTVSFRKTVNSNLHRQLKLDPSNVGPILHHSRAS